MTKVNAVKKVKQKIVLPANCKFNSFSLRSRKFPTECSEHTYKKLFWKFQDSQRCHFSLLKPKNVSLLLWLTPATEQRITWNNENAEQDIFSQTQNAIRIMSYARGYHSDSYGPLRLKFSLSAILWPIKIRLKWTTEVVLSFFHISYKQRTMTFDLKRILDLWKGREEGKKANDSDILYELSKGYQFAITHHLISPEQRLNTKINR